MNYLQKHNPRSSYSHQAPYRGSVTDSAQGQGDEEDREALFLGLKGELDDFPANQTTEYGTLERN